jgi:hypothetical protein
MRLKVGIETPCHTMPATIITRMNPRTSFARRLSFCGSASVIDLPPSACHHARTTQRKPIWLIPLSTICAWRAAGR